MNRQGDSGSHGRHCLLLDSEHIPEDSPFCPHAYRAPHFVAFVCRLLCISGVEYPSVRADYKNQTDAVNVVLFGIAAQPAGTMMLGEPVEFEPSV
jgi:hypothetical protein